MRLSHRLLEIYRRLHAAYGPQHWWPGETPFEVIVGAILTQSAAWANVEKAIANLKAAGALSPEGLAGRSEGELARLGMTRGHDSYDSWRALFMENLEADAGLFNEYHALIVRHGKEVCRREPRCEVCPLLEGCPTGGSGLSLRR